MPAILARLIPVIVVVSVLLFVGLGGFAYVRSFMQSRQRSKWVLPIFVIAVVLLLVYSWITRTNG